MTIRKRKRRRTRALPMRGVLSLFREMRVMADRPAAIVGGSLVETALEKALAARMVRMTAAKHNELFHQGVLRNYSAKVAMAEALSIYGPQARADLETIAWIRNEFAHSIRPISFATPAIKDRAMSIRVCDEIYWPTMMSFLGYEDMRDVISGKEIGADPMRSDAKMRFFYAIAIYWLMLEGESREKRRPIRSQNVHTRRYLR